MDMAGLSGKTAVITGAGRGLGLAFATALASAGCDIAFLDQLSEPSADLHEVSEQYTVQVSYYRVDVTSPSQVSETISKIESQFGRIDININAAGVVHDEPFLDTSLANIERTFAVNFMGSFLVAQACARSMVSRYQAERADQPATDPTTGTIVFIGSISTHIPSTAQKISAYVASKAAVRGLVKPLAMELSRYGIRVNSLSPGYTMTEMMQGLKDQQPDLVKQFEKETMFGRIGVAQELQGAILWMCNSKASGWYTGQDLLIDGGAASCKHGAVLD